MEVLEVHNWPRYIRNGYRLYFGSHSACPHALIAAFLTQAKNFYDLEVNHTLTLGGAPWAAPEYAPHLRTNAFFLGEETRQAVARGDAD